MSSLATLVESVVAPRQGVILDDRRLPLFKILRRLRDQDRTASWHAAVIDEELLAQGAPAEVLLQAVLLPVDMSPAMLARALECCLVDHPRIQLVHSAALPIALLGAVQPAEPSPLLPPLHSIPLADEVKAIILVKEWIEAVPLLTWRQSRAGKLKLSDILDLLDTTGESLASLHRRGYAHGSLVPDSIALQELASPVMAGQDEETVWVPKLTDLGLTRTLAPPGTWPSGAAALWCAPEAFLPDATTDWRRVDQLALAALLYALWTDQVPFDPIPAGTTPAAARDLRRKQIEALPPPRGNKHARALGVSPAMSAACMRAMSAEPADRFASLDAFSSALRQASREAGRRSVEAELEDESGVIRDSTQPGTYVTSKFRSLTVPPPAREGAPPPTTNPGVTIGGGASAKVAAQVTTDPGAALPEAPKRPEPLQVPRGVVPPDDDPALVVRRSGIQASPGVQIRQAVERDLDVTNELPPSRSQLDADRAGSRRTQILSAPAEDDGEYPAHPDEDEKRGRDADGDDEDEGGSGVTAPIDTFELPNRWAFNNLAAVLLGLWLLTLLALLLRAGAPDAPAMAVGPATTPSAPVKAEKPDRKGKTVKANVGEDTP